MSLYAHRMTPSDDVIHPNAWRLMLQSGDEECTTRTSFMPTGRGGSLLRVETRRRPGRGKPAIAEALVHVPGTLFKEAASFRYVWQVMAQTCTVEGVSTTYGLSAGSGAVVRILTRQLCADGALALSEVLTFAPSSQIKASEWGGHRLAP